MVTIILIVLSIIVSVLYIKANFQEIKNRNMWILSPKFLTGIGIGFLLIIASFIQPFTLERVDAGHVGIKVNLTGDSRGVSKFEYKTGWVIINTWVSKLYEFPTFQQHID